MVQADSAVGVGTVAYGSDTYIPCMLGVAVKDSDTLHDVATEHCKLFTTHACFKLTKHRAMVWQLVVDNFVQLVGILE